MKRLAALVIVTACSKSAPPPLAACDDLHALLERVATCGSLTEALRGDVTRARTQLADALKVVDAAGGAAKAPPELVETLSQTCAAQKLSLVDGFTEAAPGCLPAP